MAQNSYPHSDSPLGEAEWRILAREFAATAVIDGVGGELACSADGSALATAVAAGRAAVEGFLFVLDSATTVAHTAADVTNDRIDVVVVEYNPDGSGTVGQGTARLTIVAGTPDASPVVPTLTQAVAGLWQFPLAEVLVTAASAIITAPDVTDVRVFGGSVRDLSGTTAERGAYVAESGQYWWDTDVVKLYRYDGAVWQPTSPIISATDVQTFDTSSTWTKPDGAISVHIYLVGGGSGGGTISGYNDGGGGGGGATRVTVDADDLGATEAVTIGAGGPGVTSAQGARGGNTTFAGHGFDLGGYCGRGSDAGVGGGTTGGAKGVPNADPSEYGGGGGGDASSGDGGASSYGGGGGGCGDGSTAGDGGASQFAGAGGDGRNTAGVGIDGTAPGGGGGGAYSSDPGGDGAAGRAIITTYF
jgi:hypothetical protein